MITYYNKVSTGSLLEKQRVHFSQFLEFNLPMPKLEEREKIATILSTQDKLIELKEQLIAEKQQQKKYLMQQLLTGKKRLAGFEGAWENVCLGQVSTYVNQRGSGCKNCYVSTENMLTNFEGVTFSNDNDKCNGVQFRNSDVLVANIRPYLKKIWLADREGVASSDVLIFRGKATAPIFLKAILARDEFFDYVMLGAKGSKMPRGDKAHIMEMPVLCPPLPEQQAIANILTTADREIELLQQDLEQEKQKKKALMQLLLTGIVRVESPLSLR